MPAGGEIAVQVTGLGGVPAAGISAVVVNVTAVSPSATGYLTAWPDGQARPVTSVLNFAPGQVIANMITVQLGTSGKFRIYSGAASAHVVVDVFGFYR